MATCFRIETCGQGLKKSIKVEKSMRLQLSFQSNLLFQGWLWGFTYMVRMVWQTVMRITNEILGVYRVDTENAVLEGLLFCLFQIAEFAQPYMMSTPDSLSWPPQNPLSYFPFLSSGESQQRNLLWALLLWRIENRLRVWKEKVDF